MYWPPGEKYDPAEEARGREARRSKPFIVIDYRSIHQAWWAVLTDTISLLDDFEGTRAEAIAWARERSNDIRICSDPEDPDAMMVPLGPDDA